MKGLCLLTLGMGAARGADLVTQFSKEHLMGGVFDAQLDQLSEDGRHGHVTSVFEKRRRFKLA